MKDAFGSLLIGFGVVLFFGGLIMLWLALRDRS